MIRNTSKPLEKAESKNNVVKKINTPSENTNTASPIDGIYEIPNEGILYSISNKILGLTSLVMMISLIVSGAILFIFILSVLKKSSLGRIFQRNNDKKNEIDRIFSLIKKEGTVTSAYLDEALKLAMGENYSVIRSENFSLMKLKGMAMNEMSFF